MIVLYVVGGLGVLWLLVRIEVLRAMDQRAALHEIGVQYLRVSLGDINKRIDDLRRDMNAHDDDLRKYLDHTRERLDYAHERISSAQKDLRWLPLEREWSQPARRG